MKSNLRIAFILCLAAIASSPLPAQTGIHPLMKMENVYPENDVELKVSAMCFMGADLYVTVFTPDRQNQAPFREGEVFRIKGLGGSDGPIIAEKLMGGLYEPTAIGTFSGKIYIGEKDKISRLDDRNGDGKFTADEKTVLIDGISQPNFHTYTVGFGKIERDGKTYLAGNLTTSIKIGGAREYNVTVNPKTHRGSSFMLGPITGSETAEDVDIEYLAGGYRTPNGFTVASDGSPIVVDNQGVFNPSNEFIRITRGGFYGHFLMKRDDSNVAAFQPDEVDSLVGGSKYQLPPTVHMPQGSVARSPAQPMELKGLEGELSAYNGQFLVPDVTKGTMTRIFTEKVGEVWQGAVFNHSAGYDKAGVNGFTAGPNRLIGGPDGKYYIGGIGHGGLWRIQGVPGEPYTGLQRLSFRETLPESFNEMVAVRDTKEGLEIEFFRPLESAPEAGKLSIRQWTYIPTNGYGGPDVGMETLAPKSMALSEDGKRLSIAIDGLRDNSPPFVTRKEYSNENVGWVVNLRIEDASLWANEAWYTMNKHLGQTSQRPVGIDAALATRQPIKYAEAVHAAVCSACHAIDGQQLVGPNFKGLFGRKQKVTHRDGKTSDVTVDEGYIIRSILDPTAMYPVGFPPAMPDPGLSEDEAGAIAKWIKTLK
ncbi:c-type cytochrome [Akkermansiaceae bacterium]|nr:c-type cytochrome [Akkermansiaceae bacterium]